MKDFKLKLSIIIDILKEKSDKLQTLAIITENQGVVLESREKTRESVEMLSQLISEKQKLIDEVLTYDEVFLKNYEEIKGNFDDEQIRREHRDEILAVQELIVGINEKNEKVIMLERANDDIVNKLRKNIENAVSVENIEGVAPTPAPGSMTLPRKSNISKVTNKPIATIDLRSEVERTNNKENVFATKHETGKKYKFKSVIEQYKNNKR